MVFECETIFGHDQPSCGVRGFKRRKTVATKTNDKDDGQVQSRRRGRAATETTMEMAGKRCDGKDDRSKTATATTGSDNQDLLLRPDMNRVE